MESNGIFHEEDICTKKENLVQFFKSPFNKQNHSEHSGYNYDGYDYE